MLQRLPVVLAQVKAGNTENLFNEIRQIIDFLYQANEIALQAEFVAGRKGFESSEIFLTTLLQNVADIKCCEKSFSKLLWTLNVARICFR